MVCSSRFEVLIMSNPLPSSESLTSEASVHESKSQRTPLRSLTGACLSATFALLLYRLTTAIIHSFSLHPVVSNNQLTLGLSTAVRTLVMGLAAMATGIFAIVAIGLVGLAIQLTLQKLSTPKSEV